MRETRSRGAKHTQTVHGRDISPPPGRRVRGAGRQSPGRWRWREEPGRRQEGLGAGGARWDPGHSHDVDPWWSWRREEPWWRKGWRLQGAALGVGGHLWPSGLSGLVCAAHTHQNVTPNMGSATDRGTTALHSGTESLSLSRMWKQEPSLGWMGGQEPFLG